MLNEKQMSAIKCAFADLIGAWQARQQFDYNAHDWEAHVQSIYELAEAFPTIEFEFPEGYEE